MYSNIHDHAGTGRPCFPVPRVRILMVCLLVAGSYQLIPQTQAGNMDPLDHVSAGVQVIGIDHVILGVADLDAGIDAVEILTGVRPIRGGVHPQYGTHNALLATGPSQYIEILAPAPNRDLVPYLEPLRALSTPTPVAWVVATPDVEEMAQWLAYGGYSMIPPVPGSRMQSDGSMLEWMLLSPNPTINPTVPAFIEWNVESKHPAVDAPRVGSISAIALLDPAPERLRSLIRALELPATVEQGPVATISLEIETPNGAVRFQASRMD